MRQCRRPKQRGCWWPCEENVLVSMITENYRMPFIADVLNRDIRSVYAKIIILEKNKTFQNIRGKF